MSDHPQGELCSLYSLANGEDPIGSATPFDRCLIMEIPLPWPRDVWRASDYTKAVKRTVLTPRAGTRPPRLLAIEPDPERSVPGQARIFWFQRPVLPDGLFASYTKQDFLVPEAEVISFLQSLLTDDSIALEAYTAPDAAERDLFICTQDSRDACCGRFGLEMYRTLDGLNHGEPAESRAVWRVSHLGGHRLAPTLMDMPSGQSFGHLSLDALQPLLHRAGELDLLLDCYRGWSGMAKHGQIAEREVWRAIGWDWPEFRREAEVLEQEEDSDAHQVQIKYQAPDGLRRGTCTLWVEPRDKVHTLNNSFTDKYFYIDRYRVRDMEHQEVNAAAPV